LHVIGQSFYGYSHSLVLDVAVHDGFAYTTGRWGLNVWDLSDPRAPRRIVDLDRWSYYGNLTTWDDYVLATTRTETIVIIDTRDPAEPRLVGRCTVESTTDVEAAGNRAYATDGGETPALHVFDLTNIEAPSLVAEIPLSSPAMGLTIQGNLVYVATWDGLVIIERDSLEVLGRLDTPPGLRAVAVEDERACLALGSLGILVADVGDPRDPNLIGSVGDFVYASDVVITNGLARVADGRGGLRTIDLEAPDGPADRGTIDWYYSDWTGVSTLGDWLVCAAGSALLVIDGASKLPPPEPEAVPAMASLGIAVSGDVAFLASATDGLVAIGLSPPGGQELGRLDLTGTSRFVTVASNLAFIAGGTAGLHVVDVGHPDAPRLLGTIALSGDARHVFVESGIAYVACGEKGVYLVDVSTPSAPVVIGRAGSGFAFEVVAADGYAYVSTGETGFIVYDVSHPTKPALVHTIEVETRRSIVRDGYAYLDTALGLAVVDILDPSDPHVVSILATAAGQSYLVVQDQMLYTSAAESGVQVIDVSNPAAPRSLGSTSRGTYGAGLAVTDTHIYDFGAEGLILKSPIQCPPSGVDAGSFRAIPTSIGVVLEWAASHDPATEGYNLYRTDAGGHADQRVNGALISRNESRYEDLTVSGPLRCRYRLEEVRSGGTTRSIAERAVRLPSEPAHVGPASPTPTNGLVRFFVDLREASPVSLSILDASGRRVREVLATALPSGRHTLSWDVLAEHGRPAPAGLYFARIRIGDRTTTRRIVYVP
jgi:hypothetical protein